MDFDLLLVACLFLCGGRRELFELIVRDLHVDQLEISLIEVHHRLGSACEV